MQYLIIGGGPAGLSAAATLRRIDEKSRVTILAKENYQPYARIALPYLLTGEVEEELLFLSMPPGVEIVLGEEASEVSPKSREVRTVSGRKYSYDKLLLATGAAPPRPDIAGNRLPFVFTIRNLPDVHRVGELLNAKRTGRAVVAGAGPVGLQLCNVLCKLGFAITLVISSDRVFSSMLDTPASALLENKLAKEGVEICKNTDIVRICQPGEVFLSSGGTRLCDIVIFGKGVAPSAGFLAGSGVNVRQGIPVDVHQETNIPDLYAAGDVAETRDIVYGDSRVNALWPVAFEQGKVAAYNMASHPLEYEGSFSRNLLRIFDTSFLVGGMAKADGPEVHCESGPDFYHKIVSDGGVLKGFIFVGEVRNEGLYNELLRRKFRVASCADSLVHGSYSYSQFVKACAKQ